jgi:hypothetical protein
MITPKELLGKVERQFYRIVSSNLKGEEIFPWTIPSNKQITGNNYSDWKNDIVPLHQNSKVAKGKGYSVEWKDKTINGSKQSIPAKIYFETFEDYLYFIGKVEDYRKIKQSYEIIVAAFPELTEWAQANPSLVLLAHDLWINLIKVCQYFRANKPPHAFYLRDLPIEVHSKFIEQNVPLLRKLLDILLPPEWVNHQETDFASRYGVKRVNVYAQIRILDDDLKPLLGYDEVALTLDDAAWLQWMPENVFIVENQICYLTFPKMKNSVAIFGAGFKSAITKHIPWLNKTNMYCWFDLDSAGFEMLDLIRQHYPNAKSFLMDKATFDQHINFSVQNKYRKKALPLLTEEERVMYVYLQRNDKRLEQERIMPKYVKEQIENSFRQSS